MCRINRLRVSEVHEYDDSRPKEIIYRNEATTRPYDINAKIDIYKARVEGWFFDVAKQIVKDGENPGDYVAVMVALSYLEGVQQFREGEETPQGEAGAWFKESSRRVLVGLSNDINDILGRLWKETRCGLFHSGFPNGKVVLSHAGTNAVMVDGEFIRIHPRLFVEQVSTDFEEYIADLRNEANKEARLKFEALWDKLWERS